MTAASRRTWMFLRTLIRASTLSRSLPSIARSSESVKPEKFGGGMGGGGRLKRGGGGKKGIGGNMNGGMGGADPGGAFAGGTGALPLAAAANCAKKFASKPGKGGGCCCCCCCCCC
jgi:hypothetical protein